MATKSKGPKVEKVSKGGKPKKADDEKAEKRAAAKAEKEQSKASKAEQKEAAKAEKAKQKEEAKAEKARNKEASKDEKAAKKQSKSEKVKAVKVAREGEGKKPGGNKKKIILVGVAVLLVLMIAVSVFFLVRMLRGGRESTASLTPQSSETPISVGGTEGSAAGEDGASSTEADKAVAPESKTEKAEKNEKPKDEKSNQKDNEDKEQSSGSDGASSEAASQKEAAAPSADVAKQAVEGSAGTAGVAAMLGSGAVPADQVEITKSTPTDQPKPGQVIVGKEDSGSSTPETASSAPQAEKGAGTALTPPDQTQEVPDFKFSEASLNLPKFTYAASSTLEAAVHRDIGEYLEQKDDRPGVQISSVVIGGRINLPDGGVRVLAYAWGSRYAIADNTLFDYGSLVGPCALDYRGGVLEKITLARPGDQFESSVREFCGDRQDVADKMVNQAYDLELRGQMLRNVSGYIQQNNIPVTFFRASGQVYNRDGTIYLPPEIQQEEAAEEEQAKVEEGLVSSDAASLQDSYKVIQEMPE